MLLLALLNVLAIVTARTFNITELIIPNIVPPGQDEVIIECQYDADFTLLNWFKGPNEFFRYRPRSTPTTRSFPIVGVGRVEMLECGPTACVLKLSFLNRDATGLYRCDLERDVPPYMYATRTAYMQVHAQMHRRPLLEGLAKEFGEGDEMRAYCRGAPDANIQWYINGHEIDEMRGSASFKRNSTRLMFYGLPPTVTVQCAENKFGNLSGSNQQQARWKEKVFKENSIDERAQEQRNSSPKRAVVSVVFMILEFYCIFH